MNSLIKLTLLFSLLSSALYSTEEDELILSQFFAEDVIETCDLFNHYSTSEDGKGNRIIKITESETMICLENNDPKPIKVKSKKLKNFKRPVQIWIAVSIGMASFDVTDAQLDNVGWGESSVQSFNRSAHLLVMFDRVFDAEIEAGLYAWMYNEEGNDLNNFRSTGKAGVVSTHYRLFHDQLASGLLTLAVGPLAGYWRADERNNFSQRLPSTYFYGFDVKASAKLYNNAQLHFGFRKAYAINQPNNTFEYSDYGYAITFALHLNITGIKMSKKSRKATKFYPYE